MLRIGNYTHTGSGIGAMLKKHIRRKMMDSTEIFLSWTFWWQGLLDCGRTQKQEGPFANTAVHGLVWGQTPTCAAVTHIMDRQFVYSTHRYWLTHSHTDDIIRAEFVFQPVVIAHWSLTGRFMDFPPHPTGYQIKHSQRLVPWLLITCKC